MRDEIALESLAKSGAAILSPGNWGVLSGTEGKASTSSRENIGDGSVDVVEETDTHDEGREFSEEGERESDCAK